MAALKPIALINNRRFRAKGAAALFAKHTPDLPPAIMSEPWEFKRPNGTTFVMSREEERQRFLELNFAKHEYNAAVAKGKGRRSAGTRKWMARVRHYQEYLVRVNFPLILSQLCRNKNRYNHVDWHSGTSFGQEALLRAVGGFDVERGIKFSTYACTSILRGFIRCNKIEGRRKSREHSVEMPDSFGNGVDDPAKFEGVDPQVENLTNVLALNAAKLKPDEKVVIERRFGLNDTDRLTLEEVGEILGVSKERVRQVQNKALLKLRSAMEVR